MVRMWKREIVERKRKNIKTVADLAMYLRELRMASIEDAISVALTKEEKRVFDFFGYDYTIDQIALVCNVPANHVFSVMEKITQIVETGKYRADLRRVA